MCGLLLKKAEPDMPVGDRVARDFLRREGSAVAPWSSYGKAHMTKLGGSL